jgi:uncharacterized protein YuzE
MKLSIYYDSETDTLSLWNGQPADEGADVADNLTVDLNADGDVVGFTLEHASQLLGSVPVGDRSADDQTVATPG